MPTTNLGCWKCGAEMPDVPLPVGRGEECPKCISSVRVCRMCRFYDPDASNDCREIMADVVQDKEAANTCDYFSPRAPEQERDEAEAAEAKAKLRAAFGEGEGSGKGGGSGGGLAQQAQAFQDKGENEADTARRKLEEVFGGRED